MTFHLTRSFVEQDTIAPGEPAAERSDHRQTRPSGPFCDTLMPKLIAGELRVADAERVVGEVV